MSKSETRSFWDIFGKNRDFENLSPDPKARARQLQPLEYDILVQPLCTWQTVATSSYHSLSFSSRTCSLFSEHHSRKIECWKYHSGSRKWEFGIRNIQKLQFISFNPLYPQTLNGVFIYRHIRFKLILVLLFGNFTGVAHWLCRKALIMLYRRKVVGLLEKYKIMFEMWFESTKN